MSESRGSQMHLPSRAWSADTLKAGLVSLDAQQCKQEPSSPSVREKRIQEKPQDLIS